MEDISLVARKYLKCCVADYETAFDTSPLKYILVLLTVPTTNGSPRGNLWSVHVLSPMIWLLGGHMAREQSMDDTEEEGRRQKKKEREREMKWKRKEEESCWCAELSQINAYFVRKHDMFWLLTPLRFIPHTALQARSFTLLFNICIFQNFNFKIKMEKVDLAIAFGRWRLYSIDKVQSLFATYDKFQKHYEKYSLCYH